MRLPYLNHAKQADKPCIVILDEARFHRMEHLQDIVNQNTMDSMTAQKYIILPRPADFPNLNPIEKTWASIQKWLGNHLSKVESLSRGLCGSLKFGECTPKEF